MQELLDVLRTDSNTANAVAALGSLAVAVLALIASFISIVVAVRALKLQHRHNVLSVRPLPEIMVADYEDCLRVKLRNHGTGPLLVRQLAVLKGQEQKDSLIGWMPIVPNGLAWATFTGSIANRSLVAGSEIVLLELRQDSVSPWFAMFRDRVRLSLAPLVVQVGYTDIYNSKFDDHIKELEWFGRRAASTGQRK